MKEPSESRYINASTELRKDNSIYVSTGFHAISRPNQSPSRGSSASSLTAQNSHSQAKLQQRAHFTMTNVYYGHTIRRLRFLDMPLSTKFLNNQRPSNYHDDMTLEEACYISYFVVLYFSYIYIYIYIYIY
uniref:Uncharacterized protein n=1 Tax=Heterorhabditis bacteriophora TaxID=37862 RepID=A0A1I7WGU7_HETBA